MSIANETIVDQLDRERRNVSFDAYDITVRQLIDMVESNAIEIAPEYQRHFVWDNGRESQLIESVFLGIPVPSLFMATNKDGTWEVVDGVQRLSTLIHFVGTIDQVSLIGKSSHLTLDGLETLPTLNSQSFRDLPQSVQLSFLLRPLKVTTLNDRSDLSVRYELFERLNTGGVKLHPQEIRNCVFRGILRDQIKELSEDPNFRDVAYFNKKEQTEAVYEESVLRFLALLNGYKTFQHRVDKFLTDYARSHNSKGAPKADLALFKKTMEFLKDELPAGIVRGRNSTPLNLFEAISVGAAIQLRSKDSAKKNVLNELLSDPTLRGFTQGGSNTRAMVVGRIEFVRDALD